MSRKPLIESARDVLEGNRYGSFRGKPDRDNSDPELNETLMTPKNVKEFSKILSQWDSVMDDHLDYADQAKDRKVSKACTDIQKAIKTIQDKLFIFI